MKGREIDGRVGKFGLTPFLEALKNADYKCVVALGTTFATSNLSALKIRDLEGSSPLIWAGKRGYLAAVKFIMENSLEDEINMDNDYSETVLGLANKRNHGDVVKYLTGMSLNLQCPL